MNEAEVSRLVAMAWGVAAAPQRGPKRELSHERIVEAAVEIADAEGLAAVTMQRVAGTFGFTTMALYRYVASKDELHQLMLDAVVDPQDWVIEDEDWREGIQQWARILADGYARHPWALDIPLHADIMLMPGQVRGADAALRSLRTLRGDPGEKLLVISILTVYVRGFAALNREMHGGGGAPGRPERELLADIARTGELTDLAPLIASGVYFEDQEAPGPGEDELSAALALLLPGIEEHFARRTVDAPHPGVAGDVPQSPQAVQRTAELELERVTALRKATQKRVRDLEKRENRARAERDRARTAAKAAAKEESRAGDSG